MDYFTRDLPGVGGALKTVPEDFVVEELPAYAPSGSGQHLFLLVEKRGLTTQEMVRRLGQALGVALADIGTAGQKDRQAVTRQYVSVPLEGLDAARMAALRVADVTVLEAARHPHKLRTGHLRGNRFTIVIRGVVPEAEERARAILAALAASGVPNRFGAQRFGARGDNAAEGRALIEGRRRVADRFRRRLLVSAFQSELFNRYLERRMADGLLHRVLEGDVMQRLPSGGLFICTAAEVAETEARLGRHEVVPTGPIFGHAMFTPPPGTPAALREQAILDEAAITPADFGRMGRLAEGTRRSLLVPFIDAPGEPSGAPTARREEDRLVVSFALPAGSYATVVLEEIIKPEKPLGVSDEP